MKNGLIFFIVGIIIFSSCVGCFGENNDLGGCENCENIDEVVKFGANSTFYVNIPSNIGNISVKVQLPNEPRYEGGAPIVIEVGTFFTSNVPYYNTIPEIINYGFVYLTFIWPGTEDRFSNESSEGVYDYGGINCLEGLASIIKYANGISKDNEGYYLFEKIEMKINQSNVGMYAFSHPGIVMTNVLAKFGNEIGDIDWVVGRENPTTDTISSMEIGYWKTNTEDIQNPIYSYPESYSSTELDLNYSLIRWNSTWDLDGGDPGRPYWDLNENEILDENDHVLSYKVPTFNGKRTYSMKLTSALLESGTANPWPNDVSTVEEVNSIWPERITVESYPEIGEKIPNLKVMLLFGEKDHVQVTKDRPHIHQAWDGFFHGASLWVRLNPDSAYSDFFGVLNSSELPANFAPNNWSKAENWGHSSEYNIKKFPIIALTEMADRCNFNNWNDNLDEYLLN